MEQYIDKFALVAEIENRIKELQNFYKENEKKFSSILKTAILLCIDECKVILSLIDTLEVKEVDLEKELDSMITPELKFYKALPSLFDVAKHFFELGLKAQKGEKV